MVIFGAIVFFVFFFVVGSFAIFCIIVIGTMAPIVKMPRPTPVAAIPIASPNISSMYNTSMILTYIYKISNICVPLPTGSETFFIRHRVCIGMQVLKTYCPARAYELAVRYVLTKGYWQETEDGKPTIESGPITIVLDHPMADPRVSETSPFKAASHQAYAENLLHGEDENKFEYTYWRRLHQWGDELVHDDTAVVNDQIAYMTQKLKTDPRSRRAVAITWNPVIDQQVADVPCLQLVQCAVRDHRLQMSVVFRSNDIHLALSANMYGLIHKQQQIADAVGVPVGRYTHVALIPHIYYERDGDTLPATIRSLGITPDQLPDFLVSALKI